MEFSLGLHLAHRNGAVLPVLPPVAVAVPTAPGYLADAIAPYAAYGAQRVVSGYSGPLFTLRRTDGATMDVAPQAGGDYPDYAAIDAWAGSAIPTIATLHDQSGKGRHLLQANVANQPGYDTGQRFGNACPILFDGYSRSASPQNPNRERFLEANGLSFSRANMTAFVAAQSQVSFNTSTPFAFENNAGGDNVGLDAPSVSAVNTLGSNINGQARGVDSSPDTMGFALSASNRLYFSQGAVLNQSASNAATTATRLRVGRNGAGKPAMMALFGFALYDTALSQTTGATVRDSLNTAIGKPSAFDYHVLFIGDSITEGTGSRNLLNTARSMRLNTKALMTNAGIHGQVLADDYTNRVGRFGSQFRAGIPNVAFISGGTNDLAGGTAGAALYSNTTSPLVAYLKSLGFEVVVATILPRTGGSWDAAAEARRVEYNDAVSGNAAMADAVLDLTANPTMGNGNESDTTLYPDGLHPSSLGYAYLAGAPGGIYADPQTYYAKLRDVLGTTSLGPAYSP